MTTLRAPFPSLALSIDFPVSQLTSGRERDALSARLFDRLRFYGVPVTWAVERPGETPEIEDRISWHGDHEVALMGGPPWVGFEAGRTRFSQELAARMQTAREAGFTITTLALRETSLTEHLDLLVKHRLTVIRPDGRGAELGSDRVSQSVRFGIWQATEIALIPQASGWWWSQLPRDVQRVIRLALQGKPSPQIVVQADQLASAREWAQFDAVLAYLRRLRDRKQLRLGTIRSLGRRHLVPTRSIHPATSRHVA